MNTNVDQAVARVKEMIQDRTLKDRVPLPEAAGSVREVMRLDYSLVQVALDSLYQDIAARHEHLPSTILDPATFSPWYFGPREDGQWQRYLELLRQADAPGLKALETEATTITALLSNPALSSQKRKGLVMGNVQSGKTRNFAGVIAQAADAGYRFVIVLAGMHNNLRAQTQARLNADLFTAPEWYPLTDDERDFDGVLNPNALFAGQKLLCAVVKKNTTRLQYLVDMMDKIPREVRRRTPVLIVDDEADQATPNSLAQKDRISTINQRLRDLWGSVETGTYLAYTATPFANVLADPDDPADLFPSHFITTIDPGEGYFGAERVFGVADTAVDGPLADGLNMVRQISSAEAKLLKPHGDAEERESFDPDLPESLRAAVQWFVVATAIRRARGQRESHSSMLVHTTHYTAPHFAMKRRLAAYCKSLILGLAGSAKEQLEHSWLQEATKVSSEATLPLPSWEEVWAEIPGVLSNLTFVVDNGESQDRLNYDSEGPVQTVIAVGGGTLSRGLTLEGLVVSYFTRTSNTYDTLLQMGRWFGYRPGYEDLPRVWVTTGLDKDYAHLARVEKDLRDDIEAVQDSEFTPHQVGVRVRAHPGRLEITSRNKMYSAEIVQLGLSGTSNQTFLLDGSPQVVQANLELSADLIRGLDFTEVKDGSSRLITRGVSGKRISTFLSHFRVSREQTWLDNPNRREAIVEWVNEMSPGKNWNIVLVGNSAAAKQGTAEILTLGGHELACLQRTPMRNSTLSSIDLKALTSARDRLADIDNSDYDATLASTEAGRRRIRRLHGKGEGLLLLYPLGSRARAASDSPERMDMPTDSPMVGFAIVFPVVNDSHREEGTFVSVRRDWDVQTIVEGDESADADEGAAHT